MIEKRNSIRDRAFDTFNVIFMFVFLFACVFPIWYVVVGAFNDGGDFQNGGVYFWPRQWSLDNFKAIFSKQMDVSWNVSGTYDSYLDYWLSRSNRNGPMLLALFFRGGVPAFVQAYYVTILRTIVTVPLHLLVTFSFAYAFCRSKRLYGKKIYMVLCLIPMFFSGGIIPYYLVISQLNLTNTFWVYVLPGIFSYWNVLIIKTYMTSIPFEIDEAAKIDGANHFKLFFRIILPMCKPVIAALAMFCALGNWNAYYDSMVFNANDQSLRTLQHVVMNMVQSATAEKDLAQVGVGIEVTALSLQFASIVVALLPVVAVYPFVQKYFVKGVLIGSVKG